MSNLAVSLPRTLYFDGTPRYTCDEYEDNACHRPRLVSAGAGSVQVNALIQKLISGSHVVFGFERGDGLGRLVAVEDRTYDLGQVCEMTIDPYVQTWRSASVSVSSDERSLQMYTSLFDCDLFLDALSEKEYQAFMTTMNERLTTCGVGVTLYVSAS